MLPYASYAFIIVYFVSILCLILIATNRHTCTHTQRNTYADVCACVVSFNFSAHCFRSGNTACLPACLALPAPSSLLFLPVFLPSHMFSVSRYVRHPATRISCSLAIPSPVAVVVVVVIGGVAV